MLWYVLNVEGIVMSKKQIFLNVFSMNCVGYINYGFWIYLCDCFSDYCKLCYWIELVWLLECGLFDGLFIVDIFGVYDVYQGGIEVIVCEVVQLLVNDLLMLVLVMVGVIEYLGFGVIVNFIYEVFYLFVWWFLIFDYLSDGWIGWNIVIGYLESVVKVMGQFVQIEYDCCYDCVDEYLEVFYKFWEGSWEDDVVFVDCQ